VIGDYVRAQGSLDYTVIKPERDDSMERGIDLPYIVAQSRAQVEDAVTLPWWHCPATIITLLLLGPIAPILLWVPLAIVASLLKNLYWWLIPVAYVIMVGFGSLLAIVWLRVLMELTRIRSAWATGSVSVFNIRAQIIHAYFNVASASIDVFHGTPFTLCIYRILGFKVGKGTILLCPQPLESALIEIGEESVIESGGRIDGHYMEYQRFIYHKVSIGNRCWVQEGARVMPYTQMKDGSRVMPASMVLPGDVLDKNAIWCGLPAEPIGSRDIVYGNQKAERGLKRTGRIGRRDRLGKSATGFLDELASNKLKLTFYKK